ncbi:hypothetical protein [Bernardetia sp.]|uniref:hypothetical protein n=1 Tax=Bernardetia sp. TaxID=1937974 RepID=UPI0025BB64C1|nr:hypothetical protein [Bernardetia sp.]
MSKNKKLFKKIAIWTVGILGISFITLVVHIYLVTNPTDKLPNHDVYLSRIDFKESIDSLEANRIMNHIRTMKGVTNAHFNVPAGTLVYGYKKDIQDPQSIYEQVSKFTSLKSERLIVTEEDIAKGCPAFDKSGFTYQFGQFVKNIFR